MIENGETPDSKGATQRDLPLNFHWKAIDNDWIKSLNLPPPRNRKLGEARASVLLGALIASRAAPGQWISYSRRKEWWSTGRRYRNTAYTYATVISAVDDLSCCGKVTLSALSGGIFFSRIWKLPLPGSLYMLAPGMRFLPVEGCLWSAQQGPLGGRS